MAGERPDEHSGQFSGTSRVPQGQTLPRLDVVARRLRRQLAAPSRRPIPPSRQPACVDIEAWWRAQTRPVVLDLGCGTGASVATLAALHPDDAVLGIDKSWRRLAKGTELPSHARAMRGDIDDLLQVARAKSLRAEVAYVLCPNPWPKPGHLPRRLHGRPAFIDLAAVARSIELRTNWSVYAEEFAHALALLGFAVSCGSMGPGDASPLSSFEVKYRSSGHEIWRVRASGSPSSQTR